MAPHKKLSPKSRLFLFTFHYDVMHENWKVYRLKITFRFEYHFVSQLATSTFIIVSPNPEID